MLDWLIRTQSPTFVTLALVLLVFLIPAAALFGIQALLNRLAPVRNRRDPPVRTQLWGMLFGLALVLLLLRSLITGSGWNLPLILFTYYLPGVLIHECGHIGAGKIAGFSFVFMTVGPVTVRRRDGRWSVTFDKSQPAGGRAGVIPTSVKI